MLFHKKRWLVSVYVVLICMSNVCSGQLFGLEEETEQIADMRHRTLTSFALVPEIKRHLKVTPRQDALLATAREHHLSGRPALGEKINPVWRAQRRLAYREAMESIFSEPQWKQLKQIAIQLRTNEFGWLGLVNCDDISDAIADVDDTDIDLLREKAEELISGLLLELRDRIGDLNEVRQFEVAELQRRGNEVLSKTQKRQLEQLIDDPASIKPQREPIVWDYLHQVMIAQPERKNEWRALIREYSNVRKEAQELSKETSKASDPRLFDEYVREELGDRLEDALGDEGLKKLQKQQLKLSMRYGVVAVFEDPSLRRLVPQLDSIVLSDEQQQRIKELKKEGQGSLQKYSEGFSALVQAAIETSNEEMLSVLDERKRQILIDALGAENHKLKGIRLVPQFPAISFLISETNLAKN